jgi:hypothetical protein
MSTDFGIVSGRRHGNMDDQGVGLCPELHVNRFAGGEDGVCVQLTVGDRYVQLDGPGVALLIAKLTATKVVRP